MKVLLFLKKHWPKIVSFVLLGIISCYTLTFGIKKATNYEILKGNEKSQTIYTVWHIETFEGGGKARIEYLKSIARNMEKENSEVLFIIRQINPEKLRDELEASQPDIISFGFGVGKMVLPFLCEQEYTFDVRDELIFSGSFNQKFYAIPYIVSGYAMFCHSTTGAEFHCGQSTFTSPQNIYNPLGLSPLENETAYEAYKDFVYNKNVKLLGTGRDLFRVNNLNSIGRTNAMISPVDTYTDLIQYIGIINNCDVSKRFLRNCLSVENQSKLTEYSLFSSLYNKLYYDGIYNDMENAILKCKVQNVFN